MRWMCANTLARMSKMRPSPMRADTHRCHSDSPASDTARSPTTRASTMMRLGVVLGDPVVDDPAVDERVGRADHGVDDDEHQEDAEHCSVGPGEAGDAPDDPWWQLLLRDGLVAAQGAHEAQAAAPAAPPHMPMPMLIAHAPTSCRSSASVASS